MAWRPGVLRHLGYGHRDALRLSGPARFIVGIPEAFIGAGNRVFGCFKPPKGKSGRSREGFGPVGLISFSGDADGVIARLRAARKGQEAALAFYLPWPPELRQGTARALPGPIARRCRVCLLGIPTRRQAAPWQILRARPDLTPRRHGLPHQARPVGIGFTSSGV